MAFPAHWYNRDPSQNVDAIREQRKRDEEYKARLRPMKARRIARLIKLAIEGRLK